MSKGDEILADRSVEETQNKKAMGGSKILNDPLVAKRLGMSNEKDGRNERAVAPQKVCSESLFPKRMRGFSGSLEFWGDFRSLSDGVKIWKFRRPHRPRTQMLFGDMVNKRVLKRPGKKEYKSLEITIGA